MNTDNKNRFKTIIDREKLMEFNADGCPACGRKFSLGDPVVLACGAWDGPMKYVHENEADFDPEVNRYVEHKCHMAKQGRL